MSTKGHKHATIQQLLQIGELLKQYCMRDDDGLSNYLTGWSDETIATRVGCAKASVARVRMQTIGPLYVKKPDAAADEISELKLKVEQHATAISAMQNQLKAIMAQLTAYDREVQSMASQLLSSTSITKAS